MEINVTDIIRDHPIYDTLFDISTTIEETWIQQIGRQKMKDIIKELRLCDANSLKFLLPTTTGFSFTVFQNHTYR